MANVREVEFEDLDPVAALTRAVGWGSPTAAGWHRLWHHNPAVQLDGPRISRGWVLQDGPRVVGFLCNLAQQYQLGERTLRAAIPSSFVVVPEFRGKSMQLVLAYVRQPNVDLLLNTTAAPETSKIFEFCKFRRIPQPEYDRSYYWVLRETAFLNAAFRKKGFSKWISRVGGVALAPFLWGGIRLRHRYPRSRGDRLTFKVIGADAVDDGFDKLWQRKLAEGRKLLAHRTARTLRWHYAAEGKATPPSLICAYDREQLLGYLSLLRQDASHLELGRARVGDIFVERDDPDVIRQLLTVAARQARATGAAMLEVIGFPTHIRRLFQEYLPFELRNDSWPFLYKALEPGVHEALSSADLWHASLFDGDGGL